jgi:hypothetical protein
MNPLQDERNREHNVELNNYQRRSTCLEMTIFGGGGEIQRAMELERH